MAKISAKATKDFCPPESWFISRVSADFPVKDTYKHTNETDEFTERQYRNSMTPNIKSGKSPLKLAHFPCSKNEGIWCYIKKKVLKADKFIFS